MENSMELLNLKCKVMLQKIDKLCNVYGFIFQETSCKEINGLQIIKKQYLRMFNELIERGEYGKYKEIEDIVVNEISKIGLKLDEYILDTSQNCQDMFAKAIQYIKDSKNYQNFQNMDIELHKIEELKQLLKLYRPYISKSEETRLKYEISQLKFNVLFRKQIEDLIYENGGIINNLGQYDSENEKNVFKKILEEKVNLLKSTASNIKGIKEDEPIFQIPTEQILSDTKLLERLIIIDMKASPYSYINLLKAKVFNAHLCNIGNNPFEKEVYLTVEQLHRLGFTQYEKKFNQFEGLKANRVNYSLLNAILKSIVTDENITIIDCIHIYRKFGFKCRPILVNSGQKCVKMIFDETRLSKEFWEIQCDIRFQQFENYEIRNTELYKLYNMNLDRYCKINFEGLIYEFNDENEYLEDLFEQILDERRKEIELTRKKRNKKRSSKEQEIYEQNKYLQQRKEEIKKNGIITTDIDVIILLIHEVIEGRTEDLNKEIEKKTQIKITENDFLWDDFWIDKHKSIIEEAKNRIEWLKKIKSKNGKLTLEEIRKLLFTIKEIYEELGIEYDNRSLIPLENMLEQNSGLVNLAPIPNERRNRIVEISHSFLHGSEYEKTTDYISDLRPLWKKYQEECRELEIDIKKYDGCYDENKSNFEICINLDDIYSVPIDCKKVEMLTIEELRKIEKREKGDERE